MPCVGAASWHRDSGGTGQSVTPKMLEGCARPDGTHKADPPPRRNPCCAARRDRLPRQGQLVGGREDQRMAGERLLWGQNPHIGGIAIASSSRTRSGPEEAVPFQSGQNKRARDRLIPPTMRTASQGLSPTAPAVIHKAQGGKLFTANVPRRTGGVQIEWGQMSVGHCEPVGIEEVLPLLGDGRSPKTNSVKSIWACVRSSERSSSSGISRTTPRHRTAVHRPSNWPSSIV
jgi:hypothetical protein